MLASPTSKVLSIGALALAMMCPASASLITLNYSGVIIESDFSSVPVGSVFTGNIYYDSGDSPAGVSCDPHYCAGYYAAPPLQYQVDVAGSTIYSFAPFDPLGGSEITVEDQLDAAPGYSGDAVVWNSESFYERVPTAGPLHQELSLDSSAVSRNNLYITMLAAPGTYSVLDSTQLPAAFPAWDKWNYDHFLQFLEWTDGLGPRYIVGRITNYTVTAAPEPGTLPLISLTLAAGLLWRVRRKKLDLDRSKSN